MFHFILNCGGRSSKLKSTFGTRAIFHVKDQFSPTVGGSFRTQDNYIANEEQMRCELIHEVFSSNLEDFYIK